MWVRKNAHFGEPIDYDVLAGSPAVEAGLALEDEVLTIDGEPVAKLTLEAISRSSAHRPRAAPSSHCAR